MKLLSHFNDFLKDEVNLNQTRVDSLETSIQAIEDYLDGSEWGDIIVDWVPQGSWAHKTIIKPVDKGEFDADLLVYVSPVEGWEAKDYINDLYAQFRATDTYRDKVKRWSHCVTVTYANDKKIDVAPCVVGRIVSDQLEVCNRDDEVDAMHTSLFRELLTYMMEDPRNISTCTHLLFRAKSLERVGDHATNITERAYYLQTGKQLTADVQELHRKQIKV